MQLINYRIKIDEEIKGRDIFFPKQSQILSIINIAISNIDYLIFN